MGSDVAVAFIGVGTGNILGYIAKQSFIVHGIQTVRQELDRVITEVASRYFGSWTGATIGFQAALMLAMPVASMIGDLVWTCVAEGVNSTILIAAETIGCIRKTSEKLSALVLIALRVVAATIAYFCKCLICNFGMPYVQITLEYILPWITHNPCLPQWAYSLLITVEATTLTPQVTILIADLFAVIFREALFHLSKLAF